MAKPPLSAIERDLIAGLTDLADDLKKRKPLAPKYNARRIALDLSPGDYASENVVATRTLLNLSQTLFAKLLGVSPQTVRAWEQGKTPSEMARRFMDEIQLNPAYWRKRVKQLTTVKSS